MSSIELTNCLERADSFCSPDPHTRLFTAFQQKNCEKFIQILETYFNTENFDINHWYGDPDFGTLLDTACRSRGNREFVSILLSYGANPNLINRFRKKGPLHFAVEFSDYETVAVLLNCPEVDVNLVDTGGNTALHIAAQLNKIDILNRLLLHPDINVNAINRKGQTPLHVALAQENKDAVEILAETSEIDLDEIRSYSNKTCRELVIEKYPDIGNRLSSSMQAGVTSNLNNLFCYLYRKNYKSLNSCLKKFKPEELNSQNDGRHTLLQYAADFGITQTVQDFLNFGLDPNASCPGNMKPPIMLAAYKGYIDIVKLFVANSATSYDPVDGQNILHAIILGAPFSGPVLGGAENEKRDHYECLSFVLKNIDSDKLDINQIDFKGNTPLHYAARLGDEKIVLLLLEHGAYVGQRNFLGEPAFSNISRHVLEKFLDQCIETNGKQPREEDYEIIFQYHFLIPAKTLEIGKKTQVTVELEKPGVDVPHVECETGPLLYMSRIPEFRSLIAHPVLTSFINLKWYSIRQYFYTNLAFYLTFWFLLTLYIFLVYSSEKLGPILPEKNQTSINTYDINGIDISFRILVTILSIILLAREVFQFTVSPIKYLKSFENWLEIGIIAISILICCHSMYDYRHQISAIAILLSWTELVLLIGRHPLLSTHIEMFKTVCRNFLKFLSWYSIFILAFALSFYMLFKDDSSEDPNFFHDPAVSIFKSIVMLTGEFDASSIPFRAYPGISHLLFVLFVFLIAIVLFNLLNGLAVSDTQAIKSDAELVGYICRINLIHYFESMFTKNRLPDRETIDNTLRCCCIPVRRRTRHKRGKCCFKHRINLFPHVVPEGQIHVLPNQDCRIAALSPESETSCASSCNNWFIDPHIVKSAKMILAKKKEINEESISEKNYRLLKLYQKQLNEYRHRLDSVQKDSEQNRLILQQILLILQQQKT